MSFIKQVCWDARDIKKVINPDADAMDSSVFLAVHTEHNIEVSGSTISSNSMKAEEFLRNHFLAENQENEVMTVVKGESGSGKSHLIRWMELNIELSENRHIITIPKSKTNLKSVLELLIHELPLSITLKVNIALEVRFKVLGLSCEALVTKLAGVQLNVNEPVPPVIKPCN